MSLFYICQCAIMFENDGSQLQGVHKVIGTLNTEKKKKKGGRWAEQEVHYRVTQGKEQGQKHSTGHEEEAAAAAVSG